MPKSAPVPNRGADEENGKLAGGGKMGLVTGADDGLSIFPEINVSSFTTIRYTVFSDCFFLGGVDTAKF